MIYKIFKVPYKTLVRKRKGRGDNIVLSSISYAYRPSSHALIWLLMVPIITSHILCCCQWKTSVFPDSGTYFKLSFIWEKTKVRSKLDHFKSIQNLRY